jgi:predicted RNase H-like HicB family nuclease
MVRYYPAIIEQAKHGFGVFFPDLPGCTSAGASLQEAARNAEAALQAHIDVTAEHGETLPDPSDLDSIVSDSGIVEVGRILVRADLPGRSVRVNITLPEDLLAAIDQFAVRTGHTRSGLLALAVRERMQRDRNAA